MERREFLLAAAAAPFALSAAPRALGAPLGGTPVALVTADLESEVVVFDLFSTKTVARVRTGPGPRSIEGVLGRTAVIAHTGHGVVSLLDAARLAVRQELDGFSAPRYTAVRPPVADAKAPLLAYVTDSSRAEVVTVEVARGKIISRTAVPGPARHISISPDGRRIWTALGTTAERVAVLDADEPRRPRLVRAFLPPFLAHDVGFAPDGEHAWVTSGSERKIAIYRVDGRRLLRVIGADAPPQHVTFGWRTIVTPSLGQGTLSVLDRRGRLRAVSRVALAAHDASVLVS